MLVVYIGSLAALIVTALYRLADDPMPTGSWIAVYVWDGATQTWQHYFNTGDGGVPAYVNTSAAGGIVNIPQFSGVAILMKTAVNTPRLKDSNNESCGG